MTRSTVGLVVILALGLLGRAPAAAPPKRVPVLGMLLSFSPPVEPEWKQHSVFLQELRTLGWREGENLTINWLRVFRNVEASRCGHGIRQVRQTQTVR
jgi:hypothetical protein